MTDYQPGPTDRITWDAGHLDEIVVTGATVHLEALGWHGYYMTIDAGDQWIHVKLADAWVLEEAAPKVPHMDREDLLMCPVQWRGRDGRSHRCDMPEAEHAGHRCECGSRKR